MNGSAYQVRKLAWFCTITIYLFALYWSLTKTSNVTAIIVNQQTVSHAEESTDRLEQFKQTLSSAITAKSDNQRRDALSYMINQLSANPPNNPVGTSGLLNKLLPLISDTSSAVRAQLLKLFRVLPPAEVGPHVEKILMYIRGGMTHLSTDIRNDTLNVMEWLLDVAGDEVVSCPGGWLKTLNSLSSMLGWNPTVSAATASKGWTSASKGTFGVTTKKGPEAQARQIMILARFLQVGFQEETPLPYDVGAYWDNLYRLPTTANPFAYLNLFGTPRDEDSEMYPDRLSRQRAFEAKWKSAILTGMDGAKKEGGAVGRAASSLAKVLNGDVKAKDVKMEDVAT